MSSCREREGQLALFPHYPVCVPPKPEQVYLSDHVVVQDEEEQGRGSQEERPPHLQDRGRS